MHLKKLLSFAAVPLVGAALLAAPAVSAVADDVGDQDFTVQSVQRGQFTTIPAPGRSATSAPERSTIKATRSARGKIAVLDQSLLDQGIVASYTPRSVHLSWLPAKATTRYAVMRDDRVVVQLPSGASSFVDTSVRPGTSYRYQVVPADGSSERSWGFLVQTPSRSFSPSSAASEAARVNSALAVAATSTVSWVSFIPQARVDAPGAPCSYGSGYQFGGDNHGYDWRASSYRTAVHATVNWASKTVTGNVSIGTTHVYRKSDGRLVAQRTASGANSYAKLLGRGTNYVDVRMVTHAGNPFCSLNAIDGAFSLHLTTSNSWSFISGNHRQAPNHMVYIYNGGAVTYIYKRDNAGFVCLAGSMLCELATFAGYGRFA